MKPHIYLFFIALFAFWGCSTEETTETEPTDTESDIYFPPLDSDEWATQSISELGWNEDQLEPLLDFLETRHTKSFIILHQGKIVVEEYMNDHNASSLWYWASAGKTLTTAITGIAEEEGLIDINAPVSDYIGTGWTSAPLEKENLITNKHLLSMTSGLDSSTEDISPSGLTYLADAGTIWAYHGVFLKLQDVIAQASNSSWNDYFNSKLKTKIGMNGAWLPFETTNVYWSNTRSMARFGLLMYANGKWEDTQIVPESFLEEATSTSQDINLSYGYLWWLNGKSSYHLPQSQLEFSGAIIPNAPDDMYAALGKNDQKIYVVPSKDLVIVRMGDAADNVNFALSNFDDDLWEKINDFIN